MTSLPLAKLELASASWRRWVFKQSELVVEGRRHRADLGDNRDVELSESKSWRYLLSGYASLKNPEGR